MKMYQAVSESICIKEFGAELLPGWFATSGEALAAFRSGPQPILEVAQVMDSAAVPIAVELSKPEPKKRGPKPKAK